MDLTVLLLLGVLSVIGLLLVGILVAMRKKQRTTETNYQAFFFSGLCFLPLGVVYLLIESLSFLSFPFLGISIAFLSIGLANKDKWKNKET